MILSQSLYLNTGQFPNTYDVTYSYNYDDYFCCGATGDYADAGSGWWSEVTVYQLRDVIDGTKCDSDWCPWSQTCMGAPDVSNQMYKYCSGLDKHGYPRMYSDANCANWCGPGTTPKGGEMCGDIASQFCQTYTNHPSCGCIHYEDTEAFKEIQKLFEAVPGSGVELQPVCWAPQCTVGFGGINPSPNRALLNNAQRVGQQSCKGVTINICKEIINVLKTHGNVTISNNTFEETCGTTLPHFGHTPAAAPSGPGGHVTPASSPTPSPPSSIPWSPLTPSIPSQPVSPSHPSTEPNLALIIGASVGAVVGLVVVVLFAKWWRKNRTSTTSK
jgi:hypothetical protein